MVEPAKNYDVVSFARAMNDDFGGKVKKLFDPEREAALDALNTGKKWRLKYDEHLNCDNFREVFRVTLKGQL